MFIGENDLDVRSIVKVARSNERVTLSPSAIDRMKVSRTVVERLASSEKPVYGVNTGFGAFATTKIPKDRLLSLQRNILLSHACGVGEPLPPDVVRAMILTRAHTLALGHSGVRPVVVEKLCEMLNKSIVPYIPSRGSVGASGDLAPLAHVALVLIGEGEVLIDGEPRPARDVIRSLDFEPIQLFEKEGLSLVNGTQAMSACLALAVNDALNLVRLSTEVAALSADVLFASTDPYDEAVARTRKHRGQAIILRMMRERFESSQLRASHLNCPRVQDAYSLRCIPQVHGAVLDVLFFAKKVVEDEVNSVTDNPIIYGERVISQGNFHGEPLAFAADFLCIALTDLGNMIERRIDRLLNPKLNEGLPPFLAFGEAGVNSGLMIWQYTAAALCNENKVLAHPASTDTIPTSGFQEDHVSMGMNACLKLLKVLDNVETLLAIELMCGARALQARRPMKSSQLNEELFSRVEDLLESASDDTYWQSSFRKIRHFVDQTIKTTHMEWWRAYE
ncbi:MAG: Histidine ammonia-lyase [Thermotoga sp. 50_1627]|nr:MAG: Histidine ammonia-lyase [Thermotoga sp. 50_64]KUK25569.1 MAG: Histidine ammonia-lyase [Thermotoga sp. 50_1627]MDK2922605.1 histidine ammonia-lyase [Pseudothermotoga sp.]